MNDCPCSIWPDDGDAGRWSPSRIRAPSRSACASARRSTATSPACASTKARRTSGRTSGTCGRCRCAQLAEAIFTNETATGWQRVSFSTPVAITANTDYVASYHTASGNYAADRSYFAATGHLTAPLEALGATRAGRAQRRVSVRRRAGAFPTRRFDSANYWVDVEFKTALNNVPVAADDSYSRRRGHHADRDGRRRARQRHGRRSGHHADGGGRRRRRRTAALTLEPNGGFVYTPQANFSGDRSVHLHGERRREQLERRDRHHHRHRGERRAGGRPPTRTRRPRTLRSSSTAPGCWPTIPTSTVPRSRRRSSRPPPTASSSLNANGGFTYTPQPRTSTGPTASRTGASDGSALSNAAHGHDHGHAGQRCAGGECRRRSEHHPARRRRRSRASSPTTVAFTADVGEGQRPGHGDVRQRRTRSSTTATFSAIGTYDLSLTASDGQFVAVDNVIVTVNPSNSAVRFDGVNDYVTFGPAAGAAELGATMFTLETWFKREGPGVATSTGTGGVDGGDAARHQGRGRGRGQQRRHELLPRHRQQDARAGRRLRGHGDRRESSRRSARRRSATASGITRRRPTTARRGGCT